MNNTNHSSGCRRLRTYLSVQRETLRQAIDEHKWYLSERAGRDVGMEQAKQDFYARHLDRVCHEFRLQYCRAECESRSDCALAELVTAIPSLAQRVRLDS